MKVKNGREHESKEITEPFWIKNLKPPWWWRNRLCMLGWTMQEKGHRSGKLTNPGTHAVQARAGMGS